MVAEAVTAPPIQTPQDAKTKFQLTSLADVPVPLSPDLDTFVRDPDALLVLGKALFWDTQTGSDGVQGCASCHFHAGADPRVKNQLNPDSVRIANTHYGDTRGFFAAASVTRP